jgi:hypothetical protein
MKEDTKTEQEDILNKLTTLLTGEKLDAYYGNASAQEVEIVKREIEEIVATIIAAKFEGDEDNCFPVESWFVNRKTERFPCSFLATGYRSGMTMPEMKRALGKARINSKQVLEEVDQLERIIDDRERERGGLVGRLVRDGMHPLKATLIAYDINPFEYGMSKEFVDKVNSGERVPTEEENKKIAEWIGVRPETIEPKTYEAEEKNLRKW